MSDDVPIGHPDQVDLSPPTWRRKLDKGRKLKTVSTRHPLLRDRVPGIWYPDAVGVVPQYPKTPEEMEAFRKKSSELMARLKAEGKWRTRRGVPNGWRRKRAELERAIAKARADAEIIVKNLMDSGILGELDQYESPMVKAALFAASEMITAKSDKEEGHYVYTARDRMAAVRTLLDHLHAKPVQKSDVTLSGAEAFLAEVLKGNTSATL